MSDSDSRRQSSITGGRSSYDQKHRHSSERVAQQRKPQVRRHVSNDDSGAVGGSFDYEDAFDEDASEMLKSGNQFRRRVYIYHVLFFSV